MTLEMEPMNVLCLVQSVAEVAALEGQPVKAAFLLGYVDQGLRSYSGGRQITEQRQLERIVANLMPSGQGRGKTRPGSRRGDKLLRSATARGNRVALRHDLILGATTVVPGPAFDHVVAAPETESTGNDVEALSFPSMGMPMNAVPWWDDTLENPDGTVRLNLFFDLESIQHGEHNSDGASSPLAKVTELGS